MDIQTLDGETEDEDTDSGDSENETSQWIPTDGPSDVPESARNIQDDGLLTPNGIPVSEMDPNQFLKSSDNLYEDDEELRASKENKVFYLNGLDSMVVRKETTKQQEERIRKASPFGHLKSWSLLRIMVKANDDVR